MKDKMKFTISERLRVNTENVRITGYTDAGEKQTFTSAAKTRGGLKAF